MSEPTLVEQVIDLLTQLRDRMLNGQQDGEQPTGENLTEAQASPQGDYDLSDTGAMREEDYHGKLLSVPEYVAQVVTEKRLSNEYKEQWGSANQSRYRHWFVVASGVFVVALWVGLFIVGFQYFTSPFVMLVDPRVPKTANASAAVATAAQLATSLGLHASGDLKELMIVPRAESKVMMAFIAAVSVLTTTILIAVGRYVLTNPHAPRAALFRRKP